MCRGFESSCVILGEGKTGKFQNKWWGILGQRRYEAKGGWGNCIMSSFIIYTLHQILMKWPNQRIKCNMDVREERCMK